ncbi:hypothetical protein [Oscillibacter sp.]|uniref:hypothetical protein n=1 Tax=Oscillibacter sp. TaxID=1945593 RepID=UPI002D810FC3|nr:hypothetical protein [Oscillibacter sp.]
MGILNTQGQADALCTVIALGFIVSSKGELKNHAYIIYQEDAGDDAECRRHLQLQAKLAALAGPKGSFAFQTQSPGDKPHRPVILAQTDRSVLQGGVAEDETVILNRLERKVNEFASTPLRGAYVGGLLSIGSAELLDPSILYWYKPDYRAFSPEESEEAVKLRIEEAYQNALSVTETVQDFLGGVFSEGQTLKNGGTLIRRPGERPLSVNIRNKPTGADLFASVHGMTQSIIHYSGNSDPNKVNIELALSRDTCKVASCIPCSIFMWANGTPATATHFGRGDNWNFPPSAFQQIRECSGPGDLAPLAGYPYVKSWMEHMWRAYDAGKACFAGKPEPWISEDLAFALQLGREKIPQMFLEALTFESSFLNKMLRTLERVPEASVQS